MAAKDSITSTYLHECFSYDPETGVLVWKHRPVGHFPTSRGWKMRNTRYAGKPAGATNARGYLIIRVNYQIHPVHRIIWLLMTGAWPVGEIDHRNENKADNRWSNLREATHRENGCNRGANRNSTLGVKGVHWRQDVKKYRARIMFAGHTYSLGHFDTVEEAHKAYGAAAARLHGDYANHGG